MLEIVKAKIDFENAAAVIVKISQLERTRLQNYLIKLKTKCFFSNIDKRLI